MAKTKEMKQKAALAGVMMYLEEEQKAQKDSFQYPQEPSIWGHYGKQSIMTNRSIMQMKYRKR
ncbi:MAG: hypothetical protein RBS16_05760 [Candidatus Cloacimonadales bacterium]|jgi:hypothetical protein|nr:hypothetical protein [Candidatus Cloacimonadales bacterium]